MQKENYQNIEKGDLLIAHPFMSDGWFKRTVVFVVEHTAEGSLGFVMNKPAVLRLKDLLPEYPDLVYPVFKGGPVACDQLFFIHRFPEEVEGSLHISEGYYWGGNFNQLMSLIRKRKAGYETIRFFVGYSGWESGQLETERNENAWVCSKGNRSELLKINPDEYWEKILKDTGSNLSVFAHYPFEPNMN